MERQPPKPPKTPNLGWKKSFGMFGVFGGSR
jgi:hypothetical protein